VATLALGAHAAPIHSKAERRACPYYQHATCLLDIAEKACEPDEEPLSLLDWGARESVWLCCCPLPYQPCKPEEMSRDCKSAVKEHLSASISTEMLRGLQLARGAMLAKGGEACHKGLAKQEPLSSCGTGRSLDRLDLFCEMLTWQLEELGDGNEQEFERNGCPYVESDRGDDSKTEARKGGSLESPPQEL